MSTVLIHDDTDTGPGPDAATWTAETAAAAAGVHTGRPPRMSFLPWRRSQSTEIGAAGGDRGPGWYWRCRSTGCRIWCGPYTDPVEAKTDGMDHQATVHDHLTA
jgi:hypothetical protein